VVRTQGLPMRRFRRIRVDREDRGHLPKPGLVVENLSEPEAELLDAASGSQRLDLDNHEGVAMLPSEIELGVRTSDRRGVRPAASTYSASSF